MNDYSSMYGDHERLQEQQRFCSCLTPFLGGWGGGGDGKLGMDGASHLAHEGSFSPANVRGNLLRMTI